MDFPTHGINIALRNGKSQSCTGMSADRSCVFPFKWEEYLLQKCFAYFFTEIILFFEKSCQLLLLV